jgi:hypothetical protein
MIQDVYQYVRATRRFMETRKLTCPELSTAVQTVALVTAGIIVLGFGTWTGATYYRIYMSPWPADAQYHSQFMRMTASFVKPFEACQFIRDNKLHGNMMNYWTEGGAIAFGETPDPNTGVTPLQLFMDGRAQAAYSQKVFDMWNDIWNAGRFGTLILQKRQAKQKVTAKDYQDAGEWITGQLRRKDVWVALAPQGQFDNVFSRSLDYLPNEWALVYQDGKQKLFVDVNTPQGKDLLNGIKSGRTVYPSEFIRQLNLAHFTLVYDRAPDNKERALTYAIKACQLNPCQAAMQQLWIMSQYTPSLLDKILEFCQAHVQDFEDNKARYARMHGMQERFGCARIACSIILTYAGNTLDAKTRQGYVTKSRQYLDELNVKSNVMKW